MKKGDESNKRRIKDGLKIAGFACWFVLFAVSAFSDRHFWPVSCTAIHAVWKTSPPFSLAMLAAVLFFFKKTFANKDMNTLMCIALLFDLFIGWSLNDPSIYNFVEGENAAVYQMYAWQPLLSPFGLDHDYALMSWLSSKYAYLFSLFLAYVAVMLSANGRERSKDDTGKSVKKFFGIQLSDSKTANVVVFAAVVVLFFGVGYGFWRVGRPGNWRPSREERVAELKFSADRNNVQSMRLLGLSYLTGDDMAIDPPEGAAWLQKAADAGNASAMLDVAGIWYRGDVWGLDLDKAELWAKRAIEMGGDRSNVKIATQSKRLLARIEKKRARMGAVERVYRIRIASQAVYRTTHEAAN